MALVDAVVLQPWITANIRHLKAHLDVYRTMPTHLFREVAAAHLRTATEQPMRPSVFPANSSRVIGYRCLSPKQAADLRICRLLVLASVGTLRTSCGLIADYRVYCGQCGHRLHLLVWHSRRLRWPFLLCSRNDGCVAPQLARGRETPHPRPP